MGEPTMEEYMKKTQEDYGLRISRPKFDKDAKFELKGQFLKELRDNTFNGQFFYDHVDDYTRIDLDFVADWNLRELSGEEAWEAIENFSQGQKE
ncbi:hypothetical protein Tco_0458187 [Tanacetum coccineum]